MAYVHKSHAIRSKCSHNYVRVQVWAMYKTTICSQQNGLLQCSQPPGVHLTVDEMATNISSDIVMLHSPLFSLPSCSLPPSQSLPFQCLSFPLWSPLSLCLCLSLTTHSVSEALCLPPPSQTLSLTFQLSHRPTSEKMMPHSPLHSHIQSQMTW